jgi:indoleamine 2,3-dioxygenase
LRLEFTPPRDNPPARYQVDTLSSTARHLRTSTVMLPPIPVLSDYGISPENGFLPDRLPLQHLPDPYYNKWESIVANLQALLLSKRLRGVIDRLNVLSTVGLEDESEWRRAYMMLAFMAHGYIWGGETPSEVRLRPCLLP